MEISIEQRLNMRRPPSKSPIMYQEWKDLLFLHWKYSKEEIQKTLPEGLFVDTFEENAYISIVPFFIRNLKVGIFPSLPFLSDFTEVNVRTYVYDKNGVPGVWFYSLDINSSIVTSIARHFFFLPYHNTKLTSQVSQRGIQISGLRSDKVNMSFDFNPVSGSKKIEANPGSLDFFLLERYALFCSKKDQLYFEQIYHLPYFFSDVDLNHYSSNLLEVNHFRSNESPMLIHYCKGVNVDFFPLEKL